MTDSMPTTSPTYCPFCGSPLTPHTAELFGREVFCGWEPCGCEGAARAREARRLEVEEQERRELNAIRRRRYVAAGIPELFLENRPGYEGLYDEVRQKATAILEGLRQGHGAYLVGDVGTHKTLVAATAARYAIDDGLGAVFTRAGKVLDAVQDTYGTKRSAADVLDAYASARVLVLDDLGKERPTAWALPKLFDLVNERYERMKPTVVTTQFERGDLIRRLASEGDVETAKAIVSRLAEMCERWEFTGKDARLHGKG